MLNFRLGFIIPVLVLQAACVGGPTQRRPVYEPLPEDAEVMEEVIPSTPVAKSYPLEPPAAYRRYSPSDPPILSPEPRYEPQVPAESNSTEPYRSDPSIIQEQVPPETAPEVQVEKPAEVFVPGSAPPQIMALRNEAEESLRSGDYDNAAASLERAIRLQPKNAELWHQLADIRLKQGQPGLAEDLAERSSLHAKGNSVLIRLNWGIIAEARRRKGDFQGASEADAKARP